MSKFDTQDINVLNYNQNDVFVESSKEHYRFSASRDGKTPSVVPMPFSELQYIASNTDVILTGWLTFDDDEKEEIYNQLRIKNWRDILTQEDIKNILMHPTLEGLQRLVDIDNQTYFDRVRICMFQLMNSGHDVTTKVSRIVNQRYNELQKRQRRSSIILTKKDTSVTADQVKELSEQNASLQSQLDEMKKMMEQMLSAQTTQKSDDNAATDVTDIKKETSKVAKPIKKVGRSRKNS